MTLRVDGGMVVNDWLMQRLADILGLPVERPEVMETTALGAATLAGMHLGLMMGSTRDVGQRWRCQRRFEPAMASSRRERLAEQWRDAVRRVRSAAP